MKAFQAHHPGLGVRLHGPGVSTLGGQFGPALLALLEQIVGRPARALPTR